MQAVANMQLTSLSAIPSEQEQVLVIICGVLLLLVLVVVVEFIANSGVLSESEIESLARKEHRERMLHFFDFDTHPLVADAVFKKQMKGNGEFIHVNMLFHTTPATIAALLKGKKHEWIVIGFLAGQMVKILWWNKGPDGTRVWAMIPDGVVLKVAAEHGCDGIAVFHNHPNSGPARYVLCDASPQDLRSAYHYKALLLEWRMTLLEFICERGDPYLYFASFAHDAAFIARLETDIRARNRSGMSQRYEMRKTLRRVTAASTLPGA